GDGERHAVPGDSTEATGEPREERGGPSVASKLLGIQRDVASSDAVTGSSEEPGTASVAAARVAAARPWPLAISHPQGPGPDPTGLGGVLPADGVQASFGTVGRLAAPQAAGDRVAAMETPDHESAC